MGARGEKMQAEVLGILRHATAPLSAYDVLDRLRPTHPKIAPPTVYNALAALAKRGSIHRVESLKAYVACRCDHHDKASILSICNDCGTVDEQVAPDLHDDISGLLASTGFAPERHVIEVHGTCAACSADRDA